MRRTAWVLTLGFALSLIISAAFPMTLLGQTYYVDNTDYPTSCPGAGTSQNPYCSITTALEQIGTGKAGKTVIVRPGKGYYREFVEIQAERDSGAVQVGVVNPFVLKAEGTVLLDGSDEVTTWVQQPGTTIWRAVIGTDLTVPQAYHDQIRYPSWSGAVWQDLPYRRCTYVGSEGAIYLNFGIGPLVGPVNVSLRRTLTIRGSNVTVDGFTIRRSRDDGIRVEGLTPAGVRNVIIRNNDVRDCWTQVRVPETLTACFPEILAP